MRAECLDFRREVLTFSAAPYERVITDEERERLFESLPEKAFKSDSYPCFARQLLKDAWRPNWAGPGWISRFDEPWRRLLVRLYVGALLIDSFRGTTSSPHPNELQDVITLATQSAQLARLVLVESGHFGISDGNGARADVAHDAGTAGPLTSEVAGEQRLSEHPVRD
jgi:hypothetical protein